VSNQACALWPFRRGTIRTGLALGGANLIEAMLPGADLGQADLENADLQSAMLLGADLRGVT
jgi:uncharacterized protein YjbI with pentapeptide repeats